MGNLWAGCGKLDRKVEGSIDVKIDGKFDDRNWEVQRHISHRHTVGMSRKEDTVHASQSNPLTKTKALRHNNAEHPGFTLSDRHSPMAKQKLNWRKENSTLSPIWRT